MAKHTDFARVEETPYSSPRSASLGISVFSSFLFWLDNSFSRIWASVHNSNSNQEDLSRGDFKELSIQIGGRLHFVHQSRKFLCAFLCACSPPPPTLHESPTPASGPANSCKELATLKKNIGPNLLCADFFFSPAMTARGVTGFYTFCTFRNLKCWRISLRKCTMNWGTKDIHWSNSTESSGDEPSTIATFCPLWCSNVS